MARKLYNFIWIGPQQLNGDTSPGALLTDMFVDEKKATTRGVILFPALLTPLVHVKGKDAPWLELLIATEKTLTADMVNRQLKVSFDLRPDKPYDPKPIFGGAGNKIVVEKVDESRDDILTTHSRFAGLLHKSVIKTLENRSLYKIYRVKIHDSCLPAGPAQNEARYSRLESKFVEYQSAGVVGEVRRVVKSALVSNELHDALIRAMFNRLDRFGPEKADSGSVLPGQCRYAFPIQGNTVDLAKSDPREPIQSYHPIVVFDGADAFSYAHMGHVSDIHVNSRWQILGKSPARVIEYGDRKHENESPPIGKLVAETNRSFHEVLHNLCASEAHMIFVGGDLIDHIRNAYSAVRMLARGHTVHQIWDAMDLDAYSLKSYPSGVDLIAFYSLLLDAFRQHKKPFFGISGNHDCYYDAYGISPRLGSSRANGGIPADLNLTFYEALLSFGPTAGELKTSYVDLARVKGSFTPSWFEWFHLVFTPFNDFWYKLPKQSLVGLGWGTTEDLVDTRGEQSGGHLPRSDDAISDDQLELLKKAVDERSKRKVILTSHFTFLSYREDVPMFPGGKVGSSGLFSVNNSILGVEDYSRYEMGTFETNRKALLTMLGERQIQCVLTGHSHRRGLHLLAYPSSSSIASYLYDTDPTKGLALSPLPPNAKHAEPAIIVSDSAGPYPRYNRDNEFRDWGSERPGGTLVRFDGQGQIKNVKTIQATSRKLPRAVVSIDYLDIDKSLIFEGNTMKVAALSAEWDSGAGGPQNIPGYYFFPQFTEHAREKIKLYVRRLVFSALRLDWKTWIRVEVPCEGDARDTFLIPAAETPDFRYWLRNVTYPSRFVSFQFGTKDEFLASRYDWDSYWNFEVEAVPQYGNAKDVTGKAYRSVQYVLKRPSRELAAKAKNKTDWREVPPYDWRVKKHALYKG